MRSLRVAAWGALLVVLGCNALYDDSGSAEPASWWSWVCPDGAAAPESGCPAIPACPDSGAGEDGDDGGC
ncbi:MAG: hypothetical protein ABTD50_11185 [Polyangiaceae bacterium]|jgi:hypothetical protein